jgi:hypothetical protein
MFKKVTFVSKIRKIMKKFLSYVVIFLAFVSCGEDISDKTSAVFQGVKDNGVWEGGNAVATIEVGNKMTIKASTLNETMSLKIPKPGAIVDPSNSNNFITYALGTSLARKASYVISTGTEVFTYETGIGVGDGEIVIKEYDGKVISGTFRFNAHNLDLESEAQEIVNMQNGVFYRVPVQ